MEGLVCDDDAHLYSGKRIHEPVQRGGHLTDSFPNLGKTARAIFVMYCAFLAAGVLAYVLAGMPLFDSINHTMCALSTGGFSTRTDSIGAYDSLLIDTITNVLMLAGTTNSPSFSCLSGENSDVLSGSAKRGLCSWCLRRLLFR